MQGREENPQLPLNAPQDRSVELASYDRSLREFHGWNWRPCHDCGQWHDEYGVDSVLWNRVMRPDGRETDREYLCLACFHRQVLRTIREVEAHRDRMRRQEQWVFEYARQRVEALESALTMILNRVRESTYMRRRWGWIETVVVTALAKQPNVLNLKGQPASSPRPATEPQ